ncbi:hypothetical protein Leryth_026408 [Lithospermum erythrorhizon]|nr:hypothetical protein Leryth_026408 [Lithospermum erythrorhizon]
MLTDSGNEETATMDGFNHSVHQLYLKVDKLEKRVDEVEQFYLNNLNKEQADASSKSASYANEKEKEKYIPSMKKINQEASRREAAAAKRMQDLMRQFGSILRQISQHKWAWPFMQPVDVEGLGLHDYFEAVLPFLLIAIWVIDRPMDFSTIKNQMEAEDGTRYKHVLEICADVRLIFTNAMKYNDEKSDVHDMAKKLLGKFEEKWLQLLPKVTEEEKIRKDEEEKARHNLQLAQEAVHAKTAKDLINELCEVDMYLEELREIAAKSCRKISILEKRQLGVDITKLNPENLNKVLEIVAQHNPSIRIAAEEIDVDINAQSDMTLWRLKVFVKDALEAESKKSSHGEEDHADSSKKASRNLTSSVTSKRKSLTRDAAAKMTKKRNKKPSS